MLPQVFCCLFFLMSNGTLSLKFYIFIEFVIYSMMYPTIYPSDADLNAHSYFFYSWYSLILQCFEFLLQLKRYIPGYEGLS